MKKVKIKKSDIGRWVTVKWTDVGRIDSLLISIDGNSGWVFEPHGNMNRIVLDQIVDKRGFVNAN